MYMRMHTPLVYVHGRMHGRMHDRMHDRTPHSRCGRWFAFMWAWTGCPTGEPSALRRGG